MKAVVLHSGGLDSTTALAQAIRDGSQMTMALAFTYGSRHRSAEMDAGRKVIEHYMLKGTPALIRYELALPEFIFQGSGSSLMGESEVPEEEYHDPEKESPSSTVVPYRNAVLISIAAAIAESRGFDRVYLGVHQTDAQGFAYPDCTPEFIGAQESAIYIGTHRKVRLVAPFQWMTKADVVTRAAMLGAPVQYTYSCYRGGEKHCGACPTCRERIQAFKTAGFVDPVPYENDPLWGLDLRNPWTLK